VTVEPGRRSGSGLVSMGRKKGGRTQEQPGAMVIRMTLQAAESDTQRGTQALRVSSVGDRGSFNLRLGQPNEGGPSTKRGVGPRRAWGAWSVTPGSCTLSLDSSQDSRMVCFPSLLTGSWTGRCPQKKGFRSATSHWRNCHSEISAWDPIKPQSFQQSERALGSKASRGARG